jgi:hypothetical protein
MSGRKIGKSLRFENIFIIRKGGRGGEGGKKGRSLRVTTLTGTISFLVCPGVFTRDSELRCC